MTGTVNLPRRRRLVSYSSVSLAVNERLLLLPLLPFPPRGPSASAPDTLERGPGPTYLASECSRRQDFNSIMLMAVMMIYKNEEAGCTGTVRTRAGEEKGRPRKVARPGRGAHAETLEIPGC